MGFLDSLSKTLTSGVDRAKFEADKFQRTSRISGEINNIKSQIDTNIRQLGEGSLTAPEIASLAQIIAQLRDQQAQKDAELSTANAEAFEAWQAAQPQAPAAGAAQNVPISSEPSATYSSYDAGAGTPDPTAPSYAGRAYVMPESTDVSGSGMPNSSSVSGSSQAATTTCPNCGYSVPGAAAFCPNCGSRVAHA